MQTVEQVLTAATDSVTLINEVNAGTWNGWPRGGG